MNITWALCQCDYWLNQQSEYRLMFTPVWILSDTTVWIPPYIHTSVNTVWYNSQNATRYLHQCEYCLIQQSEYHQIFIPMWILSNTTVWIPPDIHTSVNTVWYKIMNTTSYSHQWEYCLIQRSEYHQIFTSVWISDKTVWIPPDIHTCVNTAWYQYEYHLIFTPVWILPETTMWIPQLFA